MSVKIDGIIDLGPNWNYKYTIQSLRDNEYKSFTHLEKRSRNVEIPSHMKLVSNNDLNIDKAVNQFLNKTDHKNSSAPIEKKYGKIYVMNSKLNDLYTQAHKIKDDKANEFLKHLYKQSLTVFDSLKEKVNDYNLKTRLDALSKNYQTKFHKFIKETQNQKIETRIGTQKVILNAIETSNGLLNRLVSLMLGDLAKKGLLQNKMAVNIVEKEVNDVIQIEYRHACAKFGVCRTANTFSKFLTDILTILLKNDDTKLKQAFDAFTETIKNNEYNSVMSEDMLNKFYKGVEHAEKLDIGIIRPSLTIIRNILSNKYKPLIITVKVDERVNKTLALLNIVEIFDKNLPGNEINSLEWDDIKNSISEWSDGTRDDIVDIMQTLIDYLKKTSDRMDSKSVQNIKKSLKYFLT